MTKKICILIFLISISVIGQNSENTRVVEIDSLISLIPINPDKNDEFNQIQSSGLISKKSWIFFNKTIGSFHEDVIYKDKSIYLIKKYTEYKSEVYEEYFYYENDKLIKYVKKLWISQDETDNEINSAYFENNNIVGGTKIAVLKIDELINHSDSKYSKWIEFINQNE
ncbi:hypothetical protein SCB49_14725 [unidentified eubacterium SCB49]|nr:hypothetical protein SCB49_14725 [unidentified eubacterium SCB49]